MLKIGYLKNEDKSFLNPDKRAAMLGNAAVDYYRACVLINEYQWQEQGLPFFYFLLPTMHQTLELLSKAICYKGITNFNPKKYSHRTFDLMKCYAGDISVFYSIVKDLNKIELLEGLEKSYLGVRYGECYLSYDGDTWQFFEEIAEILLNDLRNRTGLRFPNGFIN